MEPDAGDDNGAIKDRLTLATLQSANADLDQLHELAHFLIFPSKAAARNALSEGTKLGYRGDVSNWERSLLKRLLGKGTWGCELKTETRLGLDSITRERARMLSLAEIGGFYDGWEASVEPLLTGPLRPAAIVLPDSWLVSPIQWNGSFAVGRAPHVS